MRRLLIPTWIVAMAVLGLACGDDNSPTETPLPTEPIDLTFFSGCWHVHSNTQVFGNPGTPCRRALDSVAAIFEVAGAESLFTAIDTVTDLSFVEPYIGTGDYTGTEIPDRSGSVHAVFHHVAGACSLTTTLGGPIYAFGDTGFSASYILNIEYTGSDSCSDLGDCTAFVTFTGTRRPDGRCTP
jgi:hypothetical protein